MIDHRALHTQMPATVDNDGQLDRREGGVVYFRSRDPKGRLEGTRVRVYDCDRQLARWHEVPHESPAASHRIFVQTDRARWIYEFAKGERRELKASMLERQIAGATYTNPRRGAGNPR